LLTHLLPRGEIISAATFDYLWVQFYNNNNYTYPCSLGFDGNAALNYNQWVSFIADTPSADAKIFFGVPAAPLAANGSPSGETYYITPDQVRNLALHLPIPNVFFLPHSYNVLEK